MPSLTPQPPRSPATAGHHATTLARPADGAPANGSRLLIADCKKSDLGPIARTPGNRRRLAFVAVDPDHPEDTHRDNPGRGSLSHIANQLTGAVAFGQAGQTHKQVAMNHIPILATELPAAHIPVTLASTVNQEGR
jgi:hypothetical protein